MHAIIYSANAYTIKRQTERDSLATRECTGVWLEEHGSELVSGEHRFCRCQDTTWAAFRRAVCRWIQTHQWPAHCDRDRTHWSKTLSQPYSSQASATLWQRRRLVSAVFNDLHQKNNLTHPYTTAKKSAITLTWTSPFTTRINASPNSIILSLLVFRPYCTSHTNLLTYLPPLRFTLQATSSL